MEKELNNNLDTGQLKAINTAVQGDARAIATGDGAKAFVFQTIVQLFLFTPGYAGTANLKDLGKYIDVEVGKDGSLTVNGTKIDTGVAGDGMKMVVLCQREVQRVEKPNEGKV
jgi:hypothetical protein